MGEMITAENLAVLVGAVAALVFAISKSVEWIGKGAGNYITARAEASRIRAEKERDQVKAEADDKAAENKNIATILNLMERQTTISEDAVSAQNAHVRVLEMYGKRFGDIDDTIKSGTAVQAELTTQLKALNINVAAWPKTVDVTLAEAIDTLKRLETQIDGFSSSHEFIRGHLTETKQHLQDIINILKTQQPAPPRPTNADGAKAEPQASDSIAS